AARAICSFFFSSRRRHTRSKRDWSSDVCSSDLSRSSPTTLTRRDSPGSLWPTLLLIGSRMPFRRDGPPGPSQAVGSTKYLNHTSASRKTARLRQWFTNPETLSDFLLVGKAVVASTIAWALAVFVLGSQVAFMAPWTALLTVHATVHRSLSRGAQTTVSSAVGMGLAFIIMHF